MIDAKDIEVLSASEAVRRRPERYVGPLQNRLLPNVLLREALCCARDDALLGLCSAVEVTLASDGRARVRDDGPGLPLTPFPDGTRLAERYLTSLYACASAKPPKVADTTCVHGLAILNFLCASLTLRIFVDGAEWSQRYERGVAVDKLKIVGQTEERGTELSLSLDPGILPSRDFDFDVDEFTEWAQANVRSLSVTISDSRTGTASRLQPNRAG